LTIQDNKKVGSSGLRLIQLSSVLALATLAFTAWGAKQGQKEQNKQGNQFQVTSENWGSITAPVFGTSESGVYSGAELFAGPNKFGSYFQGVLPNGRIVKPAGTSIQVGMNPLGVALTPDGRFLVTSNDDEREGTFTSLRDSANKGAYSLSVVDTGSMSVISRLSTSAKFFIGLQITSAGNGSYTVWASGGPDNDIKLFTISQAGVIRVGTPSRIAIAPITPNNAGFVSNYTPGKSFNAADANGNMPPVPSGFDRTAGAQITFPAGSALSPDGKYLYVACNGDNSVAVIDSAALAVVQRVAVGYFPYSVSVSSDGQTVFVSNWGVSQYKFASPTYSGNTLTAIGTTGQNQPDGFYVPVTSVGGANPQTSSVSVLKALDGNGSSLALQGSIYEGQALDALYQVGDTHPSATAVVHHENYDVLYVAKSNSDRLGLIVLGNPSIAKSPNNSNSQGQNIAGNSGNTSSTAVPNVYKASDVGLSLLPVTTRDGHPVHGSYPNALAVSSDKTRLYVAEAGLNSVAVLDISKPLQPALLGRISTGWYPTALAVSADNKFLYIANAKGIGEDINPNATPAANAPPPTGLASGAGVDSNFIFGTVQKVALSQITLENQSVPSYNFSMHTPADTSIVPVGGGPSNKIKHVFFILHENKTFDSMLGNQGGHFGPYSSLTYNLAAGSPYRSGQYTGVSMNTQMLATTFAAGVNYYSDAEESDAGHQFAASGTSTDYTQKTLLVKGGRGLLVNKNFEPEDYPEAGYIFNNAARNGVDFKNYGALLRMEGTDTGTSKPTKVNDPPSGNAGYPALQADNFTLSSPLMNLGDVSTGTQGLGQSFFMSLPVLAVLGGRNPSGEVRQDRNYPGLNFNISDQRRAQEFIADFDRMEAAGSLPKFVYIYQPNDHTGLVQAPNAGLAIQNSSSSALQQVADGDVALGMVVEHIMKSPAYYNPQTGEGSAIFVTYDDAQATLDHIHPHRTPLLVVSPYAKAGYAGPRHYSTASIVKTEELLLGLPPNNYGDLFATDLRDLFQAAYNGITADSLHFTRKITYVPSTEGKRIWALVHKLDTSAADRDSQRLGELARLSMRADELHDLAVKQGQLKSREYKMQQTALYKDALRVTNSQPVRDTDD
jgi:YVTN family beta-propeller protein